MKKLFFICLVIIIAVFVVLTSFEIDRSSKFPERGPGYYVGNLHTHTNASDGNMTYDEVIETAKSLGFDFIAITDHNTIGSEVKSLCPIEKRILCIIGEEITTEEDWHILAIGIEEIIPEGLSANETIRRIHEQGGIAIPAHPEFRNGLPLARVEEFRSVIDAIECNRKTKIELGNYTCFKFENFSYVFDSDAHYPDDLKYVANLCWLSNLSFEALKNSIRTGNCSEFKP